MKNPRIDVSHENRAPESLKLDRNDVLRLLHRGRMWRIQLVADGSLTVTVDQPLGLQISICPRSSNQVVVRGVWP